MSEADMRKICACLKQTCAKFVRMYVPWGVFLFLAGNSKTPIFLKSGFCLKTLENFAGIS
jgi:hypothetical protein